MKICSNCGAENHKAATDCITCGLPLTEAFPTLQKVAGTAKPRLVILIAVAIAVVGLAVAIFLLNSAGSNKVSTTTTSAPSRTENPASEDTESATDAADRKQKLKNKNVTGKYIIDDGTLSRITTKVTHFINKNNKEDVEAMLDYFNYPINRYHHDYKLSRAKLNAILRNSLDNSEDYHFLNPNISSGTVSFDGRNYEVILFANYTWGPSENSRSNQQKKVRLKYIFNKQLELTSAYEM